MIRWYWLGQCGDGRGIGVGSAGAGNLQSPPPRPVHSVHSRALTGPVCSLCPVLCQLNRTTTVRVLCRSPRDGTSLTGLLGGRTFRAHVPAREPTRSQLRKELTQMPRPLCYPEYKDRTRSRHCRQQESGAGYGTERTRDTLLSESAASYDRKNFILFNNNNYSTKIIQSTFNDCDWRGQEERKPVWPGSMFVDSNKGSPAGLRNSGVEVRL